MMPFSDGESTPVHSSGQRPISNWGACNIGKGGWRAPPGGGEIRPPSSTRRASASEESKQVLVDTILVSFRQPMRSALVDNELSVRYELLRSVAGLVDGDDLVPFAVNDQCRLIELRKVAAKVGFRERLHRIVRSEEHTSELQSLMRLSYAGLCLTQKNSKN